MAIERLRNTSLAKDRKEILLELHVSTISLGFPYTPRHPLRAPHALNTLLLLPRLSIILFI